MYSHTKDAWKHMRTRISPQKVNASQLKGRILTALDWARMVGKGMAPYHHHNIWKTCKERPTLTHFDKALNGAIPWPSSTNTLKVCYHDIQLVAVQFHHLYEPWEQSFLLPGYEHLGRLLHILNKGGRLGSFNLLRWHQCKGSNKQIYPCAFKWQFFCSHE
jgi:hypothetical protein